MTDVVLLTGGTGGIGRAITSRLVGAGYAVLAGDVIVGSDSERADSYAGTVVEQVLDVRLPESVQAAVKAALELGNLVGVVNCAGILRTGYMSELDETKMEQSWQVNVAGMARVCSAAAPHLDVGASIVNIGSVAGSVGRFAGTALYSATKAGMAAFTRVVACELAPRGIRVNAVAPGFIRVGMSPDWERMSGGETALINHVPLGRLGETSEVAEVVEFLISPRASYITGTTLFVDGGTTAW